MAEHDDGVGLSLVKNNGTARAAATSLSDDPKPFAPKDTGTAVAVSRAGEWNGLERRRVDAGAAPSSTALTHADSVDGQFGSRVAAGTPAHAHFSLRTGTAALHEAALPVLLMLGALGFVYARGRGGDVQRARGQSVPGHHGVHPPARVDRAPMPRRSEAG